MIAGITVNGKHSFYDFGLRMLTRSIDTPSKDVIKERVPYSSVTYDFSAIFGESYGERTASYKFEYLCTHVQRAQNKYIDIKNWLHFQGKSMLYDDMFPDYHFEVSAPEIKYTSAHGVHTITADFKASPYMIPNIKESVDPARVHFPDVNGDGIVDARDVTVILRASAKIASGEDPELTPEQLIAADANMDGVVDTRDATLVLRYSAESASGKYSNDLQGWTAFLENTFNGKAVI